jgi:hypothetical protein
MIRYALSCEHGHGFEAWFQNSATADAQLERGQVECAVCASTRVSKQIMAPQVRTSEAVDRNRARERAMAEAITKMRQHVRDTYTYVGDNFAAEARAMHAGEVDAKPVWGEATGADVVALLQEGVPVAPLPPALVPTPPKALN